jgi:hypothetical protein
MGEHKISAHWKRCEGGNHFVHTHGKGPMDLEVTFRVVTDKKTPLEVDGKPVNPEIQILKVTVTKAIEVSLKPETSIVFHF